MNRLSNYGNTKTVHATLTFPRRSLTIEELTGRAPVQELSLREFLEIAGLQYVGFPFTQSNITGVCVREDIVSICVSWEEEEDVGECYSG